MSITLAKEEHLIYLNEIYNQAVITGSTAHINPVSLEQHKSWFKEHDEESEHPAFIYLHENIIAGYAYYSPYRKGREALYHTAEVSYYVYEPCKRKGIGNALLRHLVKTAPTLSFKILFAIILENNLASLKLIEKNGFEKWGFMPDVAIIGKMTLGHYYYGIRV